MWKGSDDGRSAIVLMASTQLTQCAACLNSSHGQEDGSLRTRAPGSTPINMQKLQICASCWAATAWDKPSGQPSALKVLDVRDSLQQCLCAVGVLIAQNGCFDSRPKKSKSSCVIEASLSLCFPFFSRDVCRCFVVFWTFHYPLFLLCFIVFVFVVSHSFVFVFACCCSLFFPFFVLRLSIVPMFSFLSSVVPRWFLPVVVPSFLLCFFVSCGVQQKKTALPPSSVSRA